MRAGQSRVSYKPLRYVALACLLISILTWGQLTYGDGEQVISLRILDAKSGKPLRKVTAAMITWKDGQVKLLSREKTVQECLIVFRLPGLLPDRIGFDFSPDELGYCSDLAFSTELVLSAGIYAPNKCGSVELSASFKQKPGEIILFASRVSLGERMRRESLEPSDADRVHSIASSLPIQEVSSWR